MATSNSPNLVRTLPFTLLFVTLLLANFGLSAEPVAQTIPTAAPTSQIVESHTIQTTAHEHIILSDKQVPLAREDVVPVKTAITGSGVPNNNTPVTQDDIQAKISNRYSDSKMLSFLSRTQMQQLLATFQEASLMIDRRHVSPPSYEVRTQAAVQGIINALNNPMFLQANRVSPQPQQVQNVQSQLWQLAQSQPARNLNEAVGVMQYSADIVNRGLGIRREAVAVEFLNATIDSLDKYSAFMPETGSGMGAALDVIRTAGLEENIVGIGVELKAHAQGVEIVGVVENSPAAQLGLQEGDIIVSVNGQNVGGQTLNAIADKLTGSAGTSVTLEIVRQGQRFRGTAVRRKFYVSSVTGTKMADVEGKIGYIRLKQFSESSAEDLEKALLTLHNQGMMGLVLDLRGNPGGLLDECVDLTNMFLPRGTIVSTKGPNPEDNSQEMATLPKTWAVPLVVLVDENSASASEIFAAAIQDNQRGVIIGRHSYGKGTVQTHFPMKSVSATLKLTTAKFYAPSGREMAGQGVTPDIQVAEATPASKGNPNDADMRAAVQVIRQGVPAQMAANSAAGRTNGQPYNFQLGSVRPQTPVYPTYPANWNSMTQSKVPAGLSEL